MNQLGDPTEREIVVHIPPNSGGPLPCIIYLAPFTGTGFARANWRAFSETLPQRHERLVKEGKMRPSILVMPTHLPVLEAINLLIRRSLEIGALGSTKIFVVKLRKGTMYLDSV